MKGDFSRNTFDARSHFSRVLMQQGRVQLDADWNEQVAILLHYLQTLAADLIGPYGGPKDGAGFEIFSDSALANNFLIGPGHYYVDGILCELDAGALDINPNGSTPPNLNVSSLMLDGRQLAEKDWIEIADDEGWHSARVIAVDQEKLLIGVKLSEVEYSLKNPARLRRLLTYRQQLDYPSAELGANGNFLVYLDVWERSITSIEDSHIREVALGGPDTASRAKVVCQVKMTDKRPGTNDLINVSATCNDMRQQWSKWVDAWRAQANGQLKARLDPGRVKPDPCTIAPTSAYRGQENQLYRIEIHVGSNQVDETGKKLAPTFKWSRDNGSVVAAWLESEDGALLVSHTHGFQAGQWVEITDNDHDLLVQPGNFFRIARIEAGALYLEPSSTPMPAWGKDKLQKIRGWDQTENANTTLINGAVPMIPTDTAKKDNWIDLENGLQIKFQADGSYRTGDYWLIPARTTGVIEWPNDVDTLGEPVAQPAHGIIHHYAPLGIITTDASGNVTLGNDLRCTFEHAAICKSGNEQLLVRSFAA